MNGLKYIRIRCNLSLGELAEAIGVTRQALSAWESGKKTIPQKRAEQLAAYFGIDQTFLGDILDDTKQELLQKTMFLHDETGKETYLFRPKDGTKDLRDVTIKFFNDRTISLDEEYILSRNRCKETIAQTELLISGHTPKAAIQDQMLYMHRGCYIYDMVNSLMENMYHLAPLHKMPFFFEIASILDAMLLAYNVKGNASGTADNDLSPYMDNKWITELASLIKDHWDPIKTDCDRIAEKKPDIKNRELPEDHKTLSDPQKQIKEAEARYLEMIKEIPSKEDIPCASIKISLNP